MNNLGLYLIGFIIIQLGTYFKFHIWMGYSTKKTLFNLIMLDIGIILLFFLGLLGFDITDNRLIWMVFIPIMIITFVLEKIIFKEKNNKESK